MSQKYRGFSKNLVAAAIIPLGIVATINWAIDPYGVFGSPQVIRVNHLKPKQKETARIYKAFEIRRKKPLVIFLGSSRVEEGLSSDHPAFTPTGTKNIYNAGFEAGNPYEILRYLEHTLNQQPELERVILGIDFFMFNEFLENQVNFSEDRLQTGYPIKDSLNFLLSFDALNSSKKTILTSFQQKELSKKKPTLGRFKFWIQGFLTNGQLYGRYTLSESKLDRFQEIVNLCEQRNVRLQVFISPWHATLSEAIAAAGLWSDFEQWKQEIVKITPVWDFSEFNSITTEAISDRMTYYVDSSHYSQATGDLILNRILAYNREAVPPDFGVFLTSNNLQDRLNYNHLQREQWRQNNLPEVMLVENIKEKIIANSNKNSKDIR